MSNENEPKLVSRRTFLKKTAAVTVGAAALSTLGACAPASGRKATPEWKKEVDVLVVGSGTAFFAALAAKDFGAESVLIIEKGQAFGGTSATSGGGFWIPLNYAMAAQGIEDNREDAFKYLKAVSEGQSTDDLINAYLDNGNAMLEWMKKFGYEFVTGNPSYQDYYELPGFRPYGRTVYVSADGQTSYGGMTWQRFRETCDAIGIEVMLETAGKSLVMNDNGEVIGVIAIDLNGDDYPIHARKAVILGTGGFDYNKEMTTGFLRGPIFGSNAVRTNTGDGHLMGIAVGAALANMNSCWGLPFFPLDSENLQGVEDWQMYRGKPGAIVVNKYGERIGNEASAYHVFNRSFWFYDSGKFEYRNIPSFWICDATFPQYYFMPGSNFQMGVIPEWLEVADTLEELCDKLGIDKDGFMTMIEEFNANAKNGVDPIWHRGEYQFDIHTAGDYTGRTDLKNVCLAPLETGPFYGALYGPGTCGTNGGLKINGNAQVLNAFGQPIPRLYAVGNTCGSPVGAAYPGGGSTLGAGAVFGYLGGKHAAGLESIV